MDIMEGVEVRPSTPPGSTTRTPESGAGSKQEWDVKNLMALAVLSNSLEDHQHPLIARHSTAAEAWAELNAFFESHDVPMQMHLRDSLHSLKMQWDNPDL